MKARGRRSRAWLKSTTAFGVGVGASAFTGSRTAETGRRKNAGFARAELMPLSSSTATRPLEKGLVDLPDWRITCFFVDREYRGKGVAFRALEGALSEIARLGGGVVESYPEDVEGRSISSSFIYNATLSIFERQGFERTRRLGKNHWVVTKVIA